jgi:hypothetical protein
MKTAAVWSGNRLRGDRVLVGKRARRECMDELV